MMLLLFSPKSEASIVSYKLVSEVSNGHTEEEHIITFLNDKNLTISKLSILFPQNIKVLHIKDQYSNLNYKIEKDGFARVIFSLQIPIKPGEKRLIFIKLETEERIKKKDDYYEYVLVIVLEEDVNDFEHVLKLPKDAELYSPKNFDVVIPNGTISKTTDGLVISWKAKIKSHSPKVFLVRFKKKEFNWIYALMVLLLLVPSVFVYKFGKRIFKKYKNIKIIKSLEILNEKERRIIEEIAKNEGIYQYELMRKLGYTKSSLSKMIAKLEARGLIKKVKEGKVNKLYLGRKLS